MVEIAARGQCKAKASFANDLDATIASAYGRLTVKHTMTGKPMNRIYVKVYPQMLDGEVKFYKYSYTDLHGKFNYASICAKKPNPLAFLLHKSRIYVCLGRVVFYQL